MKIYSLWRDSELPWHCIMRPKEVIYMPRVLTGTTESSGLILGFREICLWCDVLPLLQRICGIASSLCAQQTRMNCSGFASMWAMNPQLLTLMVIPSRLLSTHLETPRSMLRKSFFDVDLWGNWSRAKVWRMWTWVRADEQKTHWPMIKQGMLRLTNLCWRQRIHSSLTYPRNSMPKP